MKKCIISSFSGLLLLALSGASYAAGGDSSGGVDDFDPNADAAWFLSVSGHSRVRTCLQMGSGFRASKEQLQLAVEGAYRTWRNYMQSKHLDEMAAEQVLVPEFTDDCDHSDLKIYFGATDAVVDRAKQKYHSPLAFAHLESYDSNTHWGKGFIWIAPSGSIRDTYPDWNAPHNLAGILLHEVGHVLGNEHVPGTIMNSDLALTIAQANDAERATLETIDHRRDLWSCGRCADSFESSWSIPSTNDWAFPILVGREAAGTTGYKKLVKNEDAEARIRPSGILTLKDDLGTYKFKIQTRLLLPDYGAFPNIFKTLHGNVRGGFSSSKMYYGEIESPQGTLRIVWIDNGDEAVRIAVLPEEGQKSRTLFAGSHHH